MTGSAAVLFSDDLTDYNFGPSHPMAPVRVDLTMRLARALGLFDGPDAAVVPAPVATDDELLLVHTPEYVEAVRESGQWPDSPRLDFGIGTDDTPAFPGMHAASAHVVGATLAAAESVWKGETLHAVSPGGGLHHAMADRASGFCVYNDVAVAIRWMLDHGAERIAYIDVDAHHGDGVQAAFYGDPRVLTISLHESPRTLFPGTGASNETGEGAGRGYAVNVPLPPGTGDSGWLRAFHAVVPDLVRAFGPEVVVSQHGCDSHRDDPLTHLMLTVDCQRAAAAAVHDLAHETSGGRWLATGGGGYAVVHVVPRAWSHLLAIACGRPIGPHTLVPAGWRSHVAATLGRSGPERMTDGGSLDFEDWSRGYNPDVWLDRSVARTRKEVFPLHGIDISY